MKNYSEMSDFEINKAVSLFFNHVDVDANGIPNVLMLVPSKEYANAGSIEEVEFDPCNNPSDAWSIIVENKINVRFGSDNHPCEAQFIQYGEESVEYYHENPLRAAMIVFLMMKDAENE